MKNIFEKLLFISKFNNLNNDFIKMENIVNKLNLDYNVNKINNFDNNLMKMFKISVECNAFDVNEDKQRQCYKQLKCFWPKCRYSNDHESEVIRHISHHLNKKQFVCEECIKEFSLKSNLIRHKRSVHSTDKTFVCNHIDCNKTFNSKQSLTRHKLSHSSVKSFGCNKCNKRFKTYNNLLTHKKLVHTNVRSLVCPQRDCNKRFKHMIYLSNHKIRCHSNIKRHKCYHNNCDKSFVTSAELKQHISYKHSTERPFICNLINCNSNFKSFTHLIRHKKEVHFRINQ